MTVKIDEGKGEFKSSLGELAKEALEEARINGKKESNVDLKQRMEGLQSRVDVMNVSKTEAERQASADHSKIKQLDQISRDSIQVVNENSKTEKRLIEQLKEPLDFDGKELLKVLEDSADTTVQKLISKKTVEVLLRTRQEIEYDKNQVLKAQQDMDKRIDSFQNWLFVWLLAIVLILVSPWIWVKLVIGGIAMIGGYVYDHIK